MGKEADVVAIIRVEVTSRCPFISTSAKSDAYGAAVTDSDIPPSIARSVEMIILGAIVQTSFARGAEPAVVVHICKGGAVAGAEILVDGVRGDVRCVTRAR